MASRRFVLKGHVSVGQWVALLQQGLQQPQLEPLLYILYMYIYVYIVYILYAIIYVCMYSIYVFTSWLLFSVCGAGA